MDKLYEQSGSLKDEEKQVELFEKCLLNVAPGKNEDIRNLGWLTLERMVRRCTTQTLRKVQSRLAKRLPDISANPNIYSGLFVRQLLIKNPQVGDLQTHVIDKIIFDLLDAGIFDDDANIRDLAIDIFAIRHGSSQSDRIVATIVGSLKNGLITPEERIGMLPLGAVGSKKVREQLICAAIDLFAHSLKYNRQGSTLNRDNIFNMFEKTLSEPFCYSATLNAISALCSISKNSILPFIPRLVSMLVVNLTSPSVQLFDTMTVICELYGASSTFYKHFFVIFSALKRPLALQSYGAAAANLLGTIIRTSAPILKAEVLISVQRTILEEAVRSENFDVYESVLEAMLSNSHEAVPVPVHIVRNIINRQKSSNKCRYLIALCDTVTRPRLQNLADSVVRNLAASETSANRLSKEDCLEEETFHEKVQNVLNEVRALPVEQPTVMTIEDEKTEDVVEVDVINAPAPEPEKKNATPCLVPQQPKRSGSDSNQVPSKKLKKKKNDAVKSTVLKAGEASVEDILSTFCPS